MGSDGRGANGAGPAGPELKRTLEPGLAQMLAHPMRAHILSILNERVASPNDIAREIEIPVSDVSYHARRLREDGYIRLVGTRRRRGALEHFYDVVENAHFDDFVWPRVPDSGGPGIGAEVLRAILGDAIDSLESGAMNHRHDTHLTRTAMPVDEEGWADLMGSLSETLERVAAIGRESAERLGRNGEEGAPVVVALAGFESRRPASGPVD